MDGDFLHFEVLSFPGKSCINNQYASSVICITYQGIFKLSLFQVLAHPNYYLTCSVNA